MTMQSRLGNERFAYNHRRQVNIFEQEMFQARVSWMFLLWPQYQKQTRQEPADS